jgi:hypothetical protein
MSDDERSIWFGMLFPPLWPLVFAALICMAGEALARAVRRRWRKNATKTPA